MQTLFDDLPSLVHKGKRVWSKRDLVSVNGTDEMYTPTYALLPELIDVLRPVVGNGYVWEPAAGQGHLASALRGVGFKVVSTTLGNTVRELPFEWECAALQAWDGNFFTCPDCLRCQPDLGVIVSNPPYSVSDPFIDFALEFKGVVALLMPPSRLHGVGRHEIYRRWGAPGLIVPDKRIDYITPNGGRGAWQDSAWFVWGVPELNGRIMLGTVKKPRKE